MPLDKAGRLIASLSRTKVYKDRVRQDMRRKADIAFREMESEMLKVIKQDGKSAEQLKEICHLVQEPVHGQEYGGFCVVRLRVLLHHLYQPVRLCLCLKEPLHGVICPGGIPPHTGLCQ